MLHILRKVLRSSSKTWEECNGVITIIIGSTSLVVGVYKWNIIPTEIHDDTHPWRRSQFFYGLPNCRHITGDVYLDVYIYVFVEVGKATIPRCKHRNPHGIILRVRYLLCEKYRDLWFQTWTDYFTVRSILLFYHIGTFFLLGVLYEVG